MGNALEIAKSPALHAREAEACVLGGIARQMEAGKSHAIYAVGEDDFYQQSHRMIYCALRSLCEKKIPVDMLTVDEEIDKLYPKAQSITEDVVGVFEQSMCFGNLERYIEIVKEAATRRKLLAIAEEMARMVMDKTADVGMITDDARARLRNMVQSRSTWQGIDDVMVATMEYIEKRQKGEIVGIKSGVADVDRATGGFFPGELAIIGARPSVGKSAFGLNVAVDAAQKGHKVCFVSCEMVDSQFGQRLISNTTQIDGMKLRNAEIDDKDWIQIADALGLFSSLPISFTFGTKTVEDLRNDIQYKVDMGQCDLVVIDYLQLLRSKRRFEMEYERVGHVSRMLKEMTSDFRIPIVALAQAKRQNNNGRARCPVMDDLRSSGDIEQDADTIIFLHRPDDADDPTVDSRDRQYFDTLAENGKQYIVFSVAKQRQGQTGIIGAAFDPAHMRYFSMERVRSERK